MNYDVEDTNVSDAPRSARRRAREFAMQGVYQHLINNSDIGFIMAGIEEAPEFNKSDRNYLKRLLNGCLLEKSNLVTAFMPFLDREMDNISPIEHAVLLIGSYELLHCIDIPYKVVINEAVELTKRFGGLDGYKYVNGVLDKLAPTIRTIEIQ
jgi:transcription antitermination protein NusB